jgi:O-antigen biosynthesis protein
MMCWRNTVPRNGERSRLSPARILDLELSAPATLTGLERYVAVEALVWDHGAPIGRVTLPVTNGEVPRHVVERALSTCRAPVCGTDVPGDKRPSLTVAVCTRDRPDDLARCLRAIERLEPAADEVLVVDNAPANDESEQLVRGRHPRVRYVREPKAGLDNARNRALAEATSDIIAFTDDDVFVDPGWALALTTAFAADPEVMAVTGLVTPSELETDAQVLFERYRSFARGFAPVRVQLDPAHGPIGWRHGNTGRFGTGASMAFRREVFARVGPFDPALGAGTAARGGDDLEILFRLLKAGWAIRYEPRAVVRHRHRRTLDELYSQMSDTGVAFSASLRRSARLYPEERGALLRLWLWWAGKLMYRTVRPTGHPAALLRRLAWAELTGVIRGFGRHARSESVALATPGTLTPA